MVKTYSLIIAFTLGLLVSTSAIAQQTEPSLVKVAYRFIYINDTTHKNNPLIADMMLLAGEKNSEYGSAYSIDQSLKAQKRELERKQAESVGKIPRQQVTVQGMPLAIVSSQNLPEGYLYQMHGNDKLVFFTHIAMYGYTVQMPLPKIAWKIEKDTRLIGTYNCQKATGFFGGRMYTAWFTTELPFQCGPWKLCGLPGLILEASDAKREVQFLYRDISKTDSTEQIIFEDIDRYAKVSEAALYKLQKSYTQDPVATYKAQIGNGYTGAVNTFFRDSSGHILSGDEAKKAIKEEGRKQTNNPIERIKN